MSKKFPIYDNYLCYALSGAFLLIHIVMLIVFYRYGVTPMIYFNIFSIVFYLLTFVLIRQDRLGIYCMLVYLEVVAHMTTAVCLTGIQAGFQVTIVGLNILLFHAEYLSRKHDQRVFPAIPLGVIGFLGYLGSIAYCYINPQRYELPPEVCFWFQIAWGLIVFLIASMFMELLVMIAVRSEKSMSELASHDPLTGLFNRAGYEQMLKAADLSNIALVLIDLDNFKSINDTYGHEAGDSILKKTAEALRTCFRSDDYICRIGGDEFAVILLAPPSRDSGLIEARVSQINSILQDTSDGLPKISVSAGAAYGSDAEELAALFRNADEALYLTKSEGKRGVNIHHA